MRSSTTSLDVIQIQNPCPESWDEMHGDSRVRFCDHCRLNVYNLSDMSRDEAQALLTAREGRLCVRYYQRRDGGVVTRDCKGGLRKRVMRAATFAASATVALLAGALSALGMSLNPNHCVEGAEQAPPTGWSRLFVHPPVVQSQELMGKIGPRQVQLQPERVKMGEVAPVLMGAVATPAPPSTNPSTQPAPRK
jgi:hypothetical protein